VIARKFPAAVYGMVERVTPAGAVTEAFAWLATAVAVGPAAVPPREAAG
jgi:hypothetical protein